MKMVIGMLLISGIMNSCDNDQQQRESSPIPIFSDLKQKENLLSDTPISVRTIGIPSHLVNPNQITNHPVYIHKDQIYIIADILMFKTEDSQKNPCKTSRSQQEKPNLKIVVPSVVSSSDEECLQQ